MSKASPPSQTYKYMSLVGAGHAGLSLTLAVSCAFNTAMNARCFAPWVMKQHCWLGVVFVGGRGGGYFAFRTTSGPSYSREMIFD